MPISVACPSCGARLAAPDAAAGKRVKCRKCQAVLTVPVPEPEPDLVIDDDPPEAEPVAAPIPKRRPAVVVDEEDDADERDDEDEEEEERPRKTSKKRKGKKKKKAGPNPAVLVGVGIGAVVLLAGGFAVWHFGFRDRTATADTKATDTTPAAPAIPDGWEVFDQPMFRGLLPKAGEPPVVQTLPLQAGLSVTAVVKEAEVNGKRMRFLFSSAPLSDKDAARLRSDPDKARDEMMNFGGGNMFGPGTIRVNDRKNISPDGNVGVEFHATITQGPVNMVGRVLLKGNTIVAAMAFEAALQPSDAAAKAFLSGFKMK